MGAGKRIPIPVPMDGYSYIPSPEEQERINCFYATQLAQKQLKEGTARAQVITYYLSKSSPREEIERRMMEAKIKLLEGQLESCRNDIENKALIIAALESLSAYRGEPQDENIF